MVVQSSHSITYGSVLTLLWLTASYTFERPSSRILAQEKDDVYVLGAGNAACRAWTEARARHSAVVGVFSSWIQGYLTGVADGQAAVHNRIRSGAIDGTIAAARRQYCSAHADDKELCRIIALASRPREIMAAVSGSEVETWLDKWCAARPSETLFRGAQALTGELDMVTLETQQTPK